MSSDPEIDRKKTSLSKRILSSFGLSEEILTKLKSKAFKLKSDIEDLSDSDLKSICGLTEEQLKEFNKMVRNSHKTQFKMRSVFEMKRNPMAYMQTSCKSLDIMLNGGLYVSKITQICGEGGAGKTQLCMQSSINVQLPQRFGGLSGQALYVDTENGIRTDRLIAMAKHCLNTYPALNESLSVEKMISRIHIITCNTNAKQLLDLILNQIESFIHQNPEIRLIIIDSIAQLFRYDYNGSDQEKDYELALIAHKLKVIALSKKVAVSLGLSLGLQSNANETHHF